MLPPNSAKSRDNSGLSGDHCSGGPASVCSSQGHTITAVQSSARSGHRQGSTASACSARGGTIAAVQSPAGSHRGRESGRRRIEVAAVPVQLSEAPVAVLEVLLGRQVTAGSGRAAHGLGEWAQVPAVREAGVQGGRHAGRGTGNRPRLWPWLCCGSTHPAFRNYAFRN
jgi:hypothetical protein